MKRRSRASRRKADDFEAGAMLAEFETRGHLDEHNRLRVALAVANGHLAMHDDGFTLTDTGRKLAADFRKAVRAARRAVKTKRRKTP